MAVVCDRNEEMEPAAKRFRPSWDNQSVALPYASTESYENEDEDDNESVHSWQSAETAIVGDSGDDWIPSEDESEYDVVDEESEDNFFSDVSSSSSLLLSDVASVPYHPPIPFDCTTWNGSSFGDQSSWESSSETGDGLFQSEPNPSWSCLKCGIGTAPPRKFCFACNQRRKCYLPQRPTRRASKKPVRQIHSTAVSAADGSTADGPAIIATPADVDPPATADNICSICQSRPLNGAFIHTARGRMTAHVVYCHACTERILATKDAKCPICRRPVTSALKLFFC